MPASSKRKKERAAARSAEVRQQKQATVHELPKAVPQKFEAIDFQAMPDGMLMRLPRASKITTKVGPASRTALTPRTVQAHQNALIARLTAHGTTLDYSNATVALWRLLLRQDYAEQQRVKAEERETGLPGMYEAPPLMEAMLDELDLMAQEKKEDLETTRKLAALGEL